MGTFPWATYQGFAARMQRDLDQPVTLAVFLRTLPLPGEDPLAGQRMEEFSRQVAGASSLLRLQRFDVTQFPQVAEMFGVRRLPALVVVGSRDASVCFTGVPGGRQIRVLEEVIVSLSSRDPVVADDLGRRLAGLHRPVHLQLYVAPTCAAGLQAALECVQLALASPLVQVEVIQATEFVDLGLKYPVMDGPILEVGGCRRMGEVVDADSLARWLVDLSAQGQVQ